jgi:hypothetical protein
MTFKQAAACYRITFKRGKSPDEKTSHLQAGVWVLLSQKSDLLAKVFPDRSILSGRMLAEIFHR